MVFNMASLRGQSAPAMLESPRGETVKTTVQQTTVKPKVAFFVSVRARLAAKRAQAQEDRILPLAKDEGGNIGLGAVLTIVLVIIGAVVSIAILAALAPTWFTSIASIVSIFTSGNYTTGDDTADGIMPVFGMLIAFLGLFALIGLVFAVVQLKRGGGA